MTPNPHLPRIKIAVENSSDDNDAAPSASGKSISVLLADSSPMQLQLLTAALRGRPDLKVVSCTLDADILHQVIRTSSPEILVFAPNTNGKAAEDMALLRRLRVAYPSVVQILLVESADRDLAVNAFRSGVRGLFCFANPLSVCSANASRWFTRNRFGPAPSKLTIFSTS